MPTPKQPNPDIARLEREQIQKAIDAYRKPFLERLRRCPEGGAHIFEDGLCLKCGLPEA